HLFNRRVAFWTCLALALAPVPNDWSVDVIRGPVFVFFTVLTMYVAQMAIDLKKTKYFILTALLSGISFLFRIEGIIILFFFGAYGTYLILTVKEDRRLLLKGYSAWLGVIGTFAVFACASMYIHGDEFNRIGELAERAEHLVSLDFLEKYHIIYNQLYTLEEHSPNSDTNESFAEVARHFMFLVYVIGEARVFFKILFPLFIIPFFWGLKRSFNHHQSFLLSFICVYLLVMYVFYIDRNFLHKRFLFAPAVLAFPWVGAGLEIMFSKLKNSFRPKAYFAVFAALFIISPGVESVHSLAEEDNVLRPAGKWLSEQRWSRHAKVLSNEGMGTFFADTKRDNVVSTGGKDKYDFKGLQKVGLKRGADVLLLKVPSGQKNIEKTLSEYKKIKVFTGEKRDVYIFGAPSLSINSDGQRRDTKAPQ
ncbi:MAG: ArnT family glycosyltransferase, partial [Desulfovermiculus sp.]